MGMGQYALVVLESVAEAESLPEGPTYAALQCAGFPYGSEGLSAWAQICAFGEENGWWLREPGPCLEITERGKRMAKKVKASKEGKPAPYPDEPLTFQPVNYQVEPSRP